MGVQNQFKECDEDELEALRQEVAELKTALKNEEAAFQAQSKLLEKFVMMARSSTEEVLKTALQMTLDVAADQTASEKGSLFLLEPSGKYLTQFCHGLKSQPNRENVSLVQS